jgi:hypothetical protein
MLAETLVMILLVNCREGRPLPKPLPEAGRGFDSPPSLVGKGAGGLGFPNSPTTSFNRLGLVQDVS